MIGWEIVTWLHLASMAFFIGGQLFLAGVVVPVFRGDENREKIRAVARRFGVGTLIAFALLIVTGTMMATHYSLWSDPKFHIKLTLFVAILVLLEVHRRMPQNHALEGIVFLVSLAVMWLGVAIAH